MYTVHVQYIKLTMCICRVYTLMSIFESIITSVLLVQNIILLIFCASFFAGPLAYLDAGGTQRASDIPAKAR